MTYQEELQKTEQSAMPELYVIQSGGSFERVTSFSESLAFQGYQYRPAPIKRSGFTTDAHLGATKVTIAASVKSTFGKYIANQPIEPTRIKIYRAVAPSLESFASLFSGRVMTVAFRNRVATAICQNRSAILDAVVPGIVYQSYCNHQLFDTGCGLNDNDYKTGATVADITGSDLTLMGLGDPPDGYYKGGIAVYDTDMRLITHHTGSTVSLQLPFDSRVKLGSTLNVYPGCDGSPETCKDKFNNYGRFLGMPLIPSKNPVMWGV
ncbi:MAG: phage BR0599 family protein [Desulfatiglandales bacterium]